MIRVPRMAVWILVAVTLLWLSVDWRLTFAQTPTPTATPTPISAPDALLINSSHGYQCLLESGPAVTDCDYLIVVEFEIVYGTLPLEVATETFVLRLMNGSIELASDSPFTFVDNGYGRGLASFYFSAADAAAIGFDSTTAPDIILQGAPSKFGSTPPTLRVNLAHWHSATDSINVFVQEMVETAYALQNEWGITLQELRQEGGQQIFTADGDEYFHESVKNIKRIMPESFVGADIPLDIAERTFTRQGESDLSGGGILGPAVIEQSMVEMAAWWGMSRDNLVTLATLAFGAGMGALILTRGAFQDMPSTHKLWAGMVILVLIAMLSTMAGGMTATHFVVITAGIAATGLIVKVLGRHG